MLVEDLGSKYRWSFVLVLGDLVVCDREYSEQDLYLEVIQIFRVYF